MIASAAAAFPLFLLPARGAFEAVDPALEDVARLLGRGERSVFLAVTLPLAWRGLAAGVVLAFARSLGDFGATLMVAGNIPGLTQTAALAIYDAVQVDDSARAGRLTLLVSLVAMVALVVVQRNLPGEGDRAVSDPTDARSWTSHLIHHGPSRAACSTSRLRLGREIGVIFGRSGAGKTSIAPTDRGPDQSPRRIRPAGGHRRFSMRAKGINQPLRRRRIGMIFQDDCLFPHLNVAANIRFGLDGWRRDLAGRPPGRSRRPLRRGAIARSAIRRRSPGGERQRVGLARALAPRPRLLLCDEPVSALDLTNRHALLDRLRAVQRAEAIPMLYVTHSASEAIALGSRLFLLENGRRIAAEGPPLDILGAGRTPRRPGRSLSKASGMSSPGGSRVMLPTRAPVTSDSTTAPTWSSATSTGPTGSRVVVEIRADDILLARQAPSSGLSARNQVAGTIERIVPHGPETEVVIRTGGLTWIVSLVAPAVEQLDLKPGIEVYMIVKARSCHILDD